MSIFNFVLSLFKKEKRKEIGDICSREIHNIDKKILTKEELKERDLKLKCAQEIGNLGNWEWDCRRNILKLSKETYEMLGVNREKFNGNLEYIIENIIHFKHKDRVKKIFKKESSTDGIQTIEFKIVKPNKEERWIRGNGASIYDDNRNRIKIMGAIQDITECKIAEMNVQENLEFLQTIIDTIPNPIFYKNEKGIYKYSNNAHAEYLGLTKEEIVGKTVYDISPKELADVYHESDTSLMRNRGKQIYEAKVKYNDGSLHDTMFAKTIFTNKKDEVKGIVGVMLDITQRKISEEKIKMLSKVKDAMLEVNQGIIKMRNTNELFQLIIEKISNLIGYDKYICILLLEGEEDLRIAACKGYDINKAMDYTLKLKESFTWRETKGKFDKAIIINDIQEKVKREFPEILENEEAITIQSSLSTPIIIEDKLYGFINIDSHYNNIYNENDLEIMEYLRKQVEIAVSKHKLYEEIMYLSRYDKLTNVYNRRYFEELIYEYIYKGEESGKKFTFVIFDLNDLKVVNDTYGHLAGDEFIKFFANNLSRCVGFSNVLARLGGDEFVGVFFNISAESLVQRIEELNDDFLKNPLVFEGHKILCDCSYGIANFPNDGDTYDKIVRIADERMYKYKNQMKKIKGYFENVNVL